MIIKNNIGGNMEEISRKIKILTITPGLNVCGGIESYVMNYYLKIHNEVQMDFITHDIVVPPLLIR